MTALRSLLVPLLLVAGTMLTGCYGSAYAGPAYGRVSYAHRGYARPAVYSGPAYGGPVYQSAGAPGYRGPEPVYYPQSTVVVTQPGVTVVRTQSRASSWVNGHYASDGYGNMRWVEGHWQ